MSQPPLTTDQQAEAERIYQILRTRADADLRALAELLARKPDPEIFGATEFEVRDRVHALGAQALQTVLAERKKRGTTAPAGSARTAAKRPNSSAGKPRRG